MLEKKIDKKNVYREYLLLFLQEISIACPACKKHAFVLTPDYVFGYSIQTRLQCFNCNHTEEKSMNHNLYFFNGRLKDKMNDQTQIVGIPIDPFFHQPLWFQMPYKEHVLWGYSREHLKDVLNALTSLLERNYGTKRSLRTHLIKHLPKWLRENVADRMAAAKFIEDWLNESV